MFIAVLLTLTNRRRPPKCLSTGRWANKIRSVHPLEHYSAFNRKGIPTPATTWMNLEDIMLSETSQSLRDKSCLTPLI